MFSSPLVLQIPSSIQMTDEQSTVSGEPVLPGFILNTFTFDQQFSIGEKSRE
ncbi:MAG: hypothetical protein V7K25_26205 [Nostoc sp.]|uniref:hypothetical protein n=1 Tax=Nostoc sp. TaxID=1180 RepID=UPI002FF44ECE